MCSSLSCNDGSIGGQDRTEDTFASDDIPTEMAVAGLLAPDEPWVGIASLEYLESHELVAERNPCLLLLPNEGSKDDLDQWLEASLDSDQANVVTHTIQAREHREIAMTLTLTFALLECMIAAVAAVAMAALNTIFFQQRRQVGSISQTCR